MSVEWDLCGMGATDPYSLNASIDLGFIPVLYTYLRNRNAPAPLISSDEVDDLAPKGTSLKGKKMFLFFLPAACDVAGTTVSSIVLET